MMSIEFRTIRYGNDHVHVLTHRHGHIQEACSLHPSYCRCTVGEDGETAIERYRSAQRRGDRDVWMPNRETGGEHYVKAELPEDIECRECYV